MDRQNVIIGVIAVIVLVAAGAFFLPRESEQAALVTTQPADEGSAGDGASPSQNGGYCERDCPALTGQSAERGKMAP